MSKRVIIRNCAYPVIGPNLRKPGGQGQIAQHIMDFDRLMLDAGLVRSTSPNQLDVSNIPELDLTVTYTIASPNIMSTVMWSYANNTIRAAYHLPLEYIFVDSLQSIAPIKLKFEFFYFSPHKRMFVSTEVSAAMVPYFGCKMTVSFNGTDSIVYNHLPYSATTTGSGGTFDTWPVETIQSVYTQKKSIVCYDQETGYFYLNYCPGHRNSLLVGLTNPVASSFHLVISRSKDVNNTITQDYIRHIYVNSLKNDTGTSAYSSTSYNITPNSFFTASVISSLGIYSSDTQFQTPNNAGTYSGKYEYYTYMSYVYNQSNALPEYDPFILIGNKNMASGDSNLFYDIKVNSTETKKYLAISQADNWGYPYHADQILLVYCDGERLE